MFLKEVKKFEVDEHDIIEFASSEIAKTNLKNFLDIKKFLETKYSQISVHDLEEELLSYESKNIALGFMNVENLALGSLAALAVILSIITLFVNIIEIETRIDKVLICTFFYLIIATTIYLVLIHLRTRKKSKQLAYYHIVIKVIERELQSRNP